MEGGSRERKKLCYYVMEIKYMYMEVLEGRQVTSRGDNGDERRGGREEGVMKAVNGVR